MGAQFSKQSLSFSVGGNRATRSRQPEDQTRRSHALHAVALGRADTLHRGRPRRDRLQYRRTFHQADRLNRKNALFAGSDAGAQHWATIASLIETANLNGVEPMAYLKEVITKIVNGHPNVSVRRTHFSGVERWKL